MGIVLSYPAPTRPVAIAISISIKEHLSIHKGFVLHSLVTQYRLYTEEIQKTDSIITIHDNHI